ncbi:TOMM20-like protein 1 [Chamberlinius hualienensis]
MSTMLSKTTFGLAAAGICGTLFIGYCIYFDKKRRSDPLYKDKLKQRRADRRRRQNLKTPQTLDLKDVDAIQRFFLQEIQVGEDLLAKGEYESGIEHLANAVAVCGQPDQLLQVLNQTLPPQFFKMLIEKLPSLSNRILGEQSSLVEDDLE